MLKEIELTLSEREDVAIVAPLALDQAAAETAEPPERRILPAGMVPIENSPLAAPLALRPRSLRLQRPNHRALPFFSSNSSTRLSRSLTAPRSTPTQSATAWPSRSFVVS